MKKGFIYISILAAAVLASCVKNPVGERTLSGTGEKTPIDVNLMAAADNNSTGTKAAGREFVQGDQFVAYLRHVTWNGGISDARTLVNADKSPVLVTFTKGSAAMAAFSGSDITPIGTNVALGLNSDNTKQTSDLTASPALYWDDFSIGGKGDATDIRTSGHYLQSFYGYCFNGGAPDLGKGLDTDDKKAAGVIGWTVSKAQNEVPSSPEVSNFQKSDLLWSAEQTPIPYAHVDSEGKKNHGTLQLPFTHAMSKVTIEVICDEGFDTEKNNFENAVVKLQNMNTVATVTAPEAKLSAFATPAEITTLGVTHLSTPNVKKSFTALIAPTVFKAGIPFAKIEGVDGNTYDLVLTDAVIDAKENGETKSNAWSKKLATHDATSVTPETPANYNATNGGLTLPGVHYMITVTIKKQQIQISAIIQDWDAVSAEGVGQIQFATDVKTIVTDPADLPQFTAAFDLYKTHTLPTNKDYGKKATTVIWNNETSKWECSPLIYWQNKDDSEYFRALSGAVTDHEETPANESLDMAAGRDVLWGTTAKHSGKTVNDGDYEYYEGSPIHPRTTYVPLIFRHIMSKITVNLVDDLAGSSDPGAALNLAGATIQFTNMANTGTIELHMGGITAGALSAKMLSEDGGSKRYGFYAANDETKTSEADKLVKLKDYVVVPQAFTDRVAPAEDAYIIITLADGTTYKLKLNTCQTLVTAATDETPAVYEDINKWQRGKHYTYTISLAKEQITFRAMIKDWVEKTGSGNANLEWD